MVCRGESCDSATPWCSPSLLPPEIVVGLGLVIQTEEALFSFTPPTSPNHQAPLTQDSLRYVCIVRAEQ